MPYATALFLIAFGAALFWLLIHPERVRDAAMLKFASLCYAGALVPGALSDYTVFLILSWGLLVGATVLLYFALEPETEAEKPRRKMNRDYEPMMPLSHRDENPPTAPVPPEPPMI